MREPSEQKLTNVPPTPMDDIEQQQQQQIQLRLRAGVDALSPKQQ